MFKIVGISRSYGHFSIHTNKFSIDISIDLPDNREDDVDIDSPGAFNVFSGAFILKIDGFQDHRTINGQLCRFFVMTTSNGPITIVVSRGINNSRSHNVTVCVTEAKATVPPAIRDFRQNIVL